MQSILIPGTIVREQYAVEEVLDHGSSGNVYLVREQQDQRRSFALKEMATSKRKERRRYIFESTKLSKLAHSALPHVYYAFKDEQERVYILMEYIEGTNLEVARLQEPEQRFLLSQLVAPMSSVVEAVSYLHSQQPAIIHGNIKPSNIIVPKAENPAVLVGFGREKEYDEEETVTNIRRVTSSYEAPEQLIEVASLHTDIYALGATLYTLLTGTVPPDSLYRRTELGDKKPDPLIPANQLNPSIPTPVAEAIYRAMSIYSDDRFSTVEQFWEDIKQSTNIITIEQNITEHLATTPAGDNTPLDVNLFGQNVIVPPLAEGKALEVHVDIMVQHTREPVVEIENVAALQILVPGKTEHAGTFSDLPHSVPALSEEVKTLITTSPDEPEQVHSFKKYKMAFLMFFAVIVTLYSSLGVGVSLWYYTTAHHPSIATISTSLPPTAQTSLSSTASSSSTTVSTSASLYYGTIYDIPANLSTQMSLSHVQQTRITISGSFAGLNRTGTFNGTIDGSKHMQFTVKDAAGHLIFSFDGNMQSGGTLSGNYCSVNQQAQCMGGYGIWSVAPES